MKVIANVTGLAPETLFSLLRQEVQWQAGITHRGGALPRRFATQALIESGKIPLYRHPMDGDPVVHPFSPTVDRVRSRLETLLGEPFNHVIIQEYRSGEDFIAEHADKTLDIAHNSAIVNYSIGETRVMKLRSKDAVEAGSTTHEIIDIPLAHDSAFVLDLAMNRKYKHSIRKAGGNTAVGPRISLTFRNIATFYDTTVEDEHCVHGQGAVEASDKGLFGGRAVACLAYRKCQFYGNLGRSV